jgi:FkbM family methyltransferase
MKISKSVTQNSFLNRFIEMLIRSHPLIYIISKKILSYTSIFEDDMQGVRILKFKKKKINYIDVGASDGISVRYFKKFIKFKNIICYEPNLFFKKRLEKIRSKKIKIFYNGLSDYNKSLKLYVPVYNFFNLKMYLHTYLFYKKKDLKKQINLDFIFKKNIKIETVKYFLKKPKIKNFKPDLIKIDVNGHEFEVIKSLKKIIFDYKPVIVVERGGHIKKISKILEKKKYKKYSFNIENQSFEVNPKNIPLSYYFLTDNHL